MTRAPPASAPRERGVAAVALGALVALSAAACVEPHAAPRPAAAAPPKSSHIEGAAWLTADATRAQALGAGQLTVLGADVASEGDRVGAFVELEPNACLLAITRSSPQVIDADLFAYEEDGTPFAADESPDAQAALLLCSPTPRRLYVLARVLTGAGVVAVGVLPVPKTAEAAVKHAFAPRAHGDDDASRAEGFPGLEGRVRARRAALGGRWDEVRRSSLPLEARASTRFSAGVEAGRCLDVFLAASEEITTLDLTVEDGQGRIVAAGKPTGRDRAVVLCSSAPKQLDFVIRTRATQGQVAVSLARSQPGGDAELPASIRAVHLTPPRDLAAARAALDRSLRARGYGPGRQIALGVARTGVRTSTGVDLPRGCARVDVVVGSPFSELAAALWDEKGGMIGDVRSGGAAALFACGPGGAARLDFEPLDTGGPFAVEIRAEHAAPPPLVSHPIAAARLLGRVAASGREVVVDAFADARVLTLEPGALKSVPLVAPANGCVEVFAAIDAGGAGLDLRTLEAGAKEGDVARARFVTVNRLCGGANGARGVAELRLDAGKADALVWTQSSP
ncbi:MAG TPA: hypothetical protein VGM56_28905 [Byssovorax sp.]|jgi:hypothetical protein